MVEGAGSKDYPNIKNWAFADPEGFQKLIDVVTDATALYLKQQIAAGAEVVQIFDTWAMALPAVYHQRLVFDPLEKIAALIHADFPDVPIIGFPRGIGAAYAHAAKLAGISGLSIDWGMDPASAAENIQPHKTVQGNIDPRLVVAGGAPMRDEALRILDLLVTGPSSSIWAMDSCRKHRPSMSPSWQNW